MKVIHLSRRDAGGAGIAANRIHQALKSVGVESKMYVLWNNRKKEGVLDIYSNKKKWYYKLTKHYNNHVLGKYQKNYQRTHTVRSIYNYQYKSPVKIHQYIDVEEADAIILHWVNNFFNIPHFLKHTKKPVFWIFHDMTPFTGGYPYVGGINTNEQEVFNKCLSIKQKIFTDKAPFGIATTQSFYDLAATQGLFHKEMLRVIPCPIDINTFKNIGVLASRDILGLPADKKILSFVAVDIQDDRKGFKYIISILEKLIHNDIHILIIGNNPETSMLDHPNIHKYGYVDNELVMSLLYNASNIFVTPALEESFGQTTLESLACGTPVVSFNTAGANSLIHSGNGIISHDINEESLYQSIIEGFDSTFHPENISCQIHANYNYKLIASKYIEEIKRYPTNKLLFTQ